MRHQLVKRDQMLPNPLILFLAVVERKLVKILRLDKVRQTLARMHILVDLHENLLGLCNHPARKLAVGPCLALLEARLMLDALGQEGLTCIRAVSIHYRRFSGDVGILGDVRERLSWLVMKLRLVELGLVVVHRIGQELIDPLVTVSCCHDTW